MIPMRKIVIRGETGSSGVIAAAAGVLMRNYAGLDIQSETVRVTKIIASASALSPSRRTNKLFFAQRSGFHSRPNRVPK